MKKVTYPLVKVHGVLRPFVPVVFINPDTEEHFTEMALLDTGADTCAFPKHICKETGHNINGNGVKSSFNSGIGGNKITTYMHTFVIGLLDPTCSQIVKVSKRMLISCFDHDDAPPLLGGNDFMIDLKLEFDYKNEKITISWD